MLQLQTQAERRLEGEKRQKKLDSHTISPHKQRKIKRRLLLKKKQLHFPSESSLEKKGTKKQKKGLHILGRNKYEAFSNEINASR